MAKKIPALRQAASAGPARPIRRRRSARARSQCVNIMEICKSINARTQKWKPVCRFRWSHTRGSRIVVSLRPQTPPSALPKKHPASNRAPKTVGTQIVGRVTKQQVQELAEQQMPDLNCASVESSMARWWVGPLDGPPVVE